MRKYMSLFLLVVAVGLSACAKKEGPSEGAPPAPAPVETQTSSGGLYIEFSHVNNAEVRRIKMGNCEYILAATNGVAIIHAADCSNTAHTTSPVSSGM